LQRVHQENRIKIFLRFLEISIGSAYEIETQLLIASDLGFIENTKTDEIIKKLNEIVKMISKFKSTLKDTV
jgi:four helix bundle protein